MLRASAAIALLLGLFATVPELEAARTPRQAQTTKDGFSCTSAIRYEGLGARPGKGRALPFGAGLISSPETSERVVAIDPSGKELFFTLLAPAGPQIMHSIYANGRWQPPTRASFSNVGVNTEPSFSPDGRTLYFVSSRPPSQGVDIWKVERAAGGWSEPVRLDDAVNGPGLEWHPQATANGDLYFAADDRSDSHGDADLYVARFNGGVYQPAENLGGQINTAAREWDGYVSPSGDYLIFKSNRPGGHGGLDIYISDRTEHGWSPPRNLGAAINTADDEDSGEVTPDGRYLTFARSRPGAQFWEMYWIDMRAIRSDASSRPARRGCVSR